MKCKQCGNEVDTTKLSKYASGNYCSKICAKKYAANTTNHSELKQGKCSVCGKGMGVKKNASNKQVKCDDCKKIKICNYCGQKKPCKRADVCGKHQLFPTLVKYFGFDTSKIGNIEIYEEFDRVKNILIEDYGDKELSTIDICNKYNIPDFKNFNKILKSMNIKLRDKSSEVILSGKNGKLNGLNLYNQYKCGWHKTGNGKDVFYRSSYELEYAQQLDEHQVDYNMENLRILYGDSQLLRQRVAIPDFYLSESNTIVEIKSDYTYDKQNMEDKIKVYKEHGYNFKLILEKKEVINGGVG